MAANKKGVSACMLGNEYIYIFGGGDTDLNIFVNDIEKYNIDNNTWQTIRINSMEQMTPRCSAFTYAISPT